MKQPEDQKIMVTKARAVDAIDADIVAGEIQENGVVASGEVPLSWRRW